MKKLIKTGAILLAAAAVFVLGGLIADKIQLREDILRLHVVAASDSEADQQIKLQVRDAILEYLAPAAEQMTDKDSAQIYVQQQLTQLEAVANRVLEAAGSTDTATVTLTQECFDMREYDTFCLPAGVYDALRVKIGSGEGQNWWCVVFPSFCQQAASGELLDTAVAAGMNETLAETIEKNDRYEVRFFILDCLGRLENFFLKG